ncbi:MULTISPECIES: hypothetical protein [Cupriavidus]|uniref:hypothetical protein n=1 Tax=Cupriavidus TaxID=106589 RepID=UPI000B11BBB6|nr:MULTISPECIES: hypothetical protein [Cupriavidus]
MNYPTPSYFRQSVGEQLLAHYARRDAVRHSTPLLPIQWSALRALFHRSGSGTQKTV